MERFHVRAIENKTAYNIGIFRYVRYQLKGKVKSYEPSGPLLPELTPVSVALRVLLVLLDGMLVHRR